MDLCTPAKARTNYLKKFKDIFTRRNYQSLHHFIKSSPWDEEEINTRRVEIMEQDKRTCSKAGGALIIDDTSNKKSGKNTEGAKAC